MTDTAKLLDEAIEIIQAYLKSAEHPRGAAILPEIDGFARKFLKRANPPVRLYPVKKARKA